MSSVSKPTWSDDRPAEAQALELVADRWGMWLLVALGEHGAARFSDLAGAPGLSRRVLTERLVRLVDAGLVAREQYVARPQRYRYRLTDRGVQVQRLCVALLHVAGGGSLPELVQAQEARARARENNDAARAAPMPAGGADIPPAAAGPADDAHPSDRLLETDLDAAWTIYGQTVAALVRYDEQYRTQLTDTLEAYLQCDASVSVTAARLFAHRHTVRYRLGRVRELTGLDVDTLADRERLVLGLRALRIFQRHGRELV